MEDENFMKAMVLQAIGQPLVLKTLPLPVPAPHQVLVKVTACGVCRTETHIYPPRQMKR